MKPHLPLYQIEHKICPKLAPQFAPFCPTKKDVGGRMVAVLRDRSETKFFQTARGFFDRPAIHGDTRRKMSPNCVFFIKTLYFCGVPGFCPQICPTMPPFILFLHEKSSGFSAARLISFYGMMPVCRRSISARFVSSIVCAYRSIVIAKLLWPKISFSVCGFIPLSSARVANVSRNA